VKSWFACVFFFMLPLFPLAAQTHVALTSPAGTEFWLYTPANYSVGTPAPMLMSLHGIGQINPSPLGGCSSINCLISMAGDATPAYLIATNRWDTSRPFVVVSPQLKSDGTGLEQDWSADIIDEVLEYVKTLKNIDNNRIYFSGLSLGGQGAMIYTIAHPNKVAAIVAMANRTIEIIQDACTLAGKPLWMFHGTEDTTVPYTNSIDMYNAILSCTNTTTFSPHLTTVHAVNHNNLWNPIYDLTAGHDIYNWLLKFSLNNTNNISPYVNAGPNRIFKPGAKSIHIHADAFDSDGAIASVLWTQTSGQPLQLENVNSLVLTINNPPAGTYNFQLSAIDNLGLQQTDALTITVTNGVSNDHAITGFILYNGVTNTPLGTFTDSMIINKNLLGITQINIQAISDKQGQGGRSVLFQINEHRYTRTSGVFGSSLAFIINQSSGPEWRVFPDEYTICATGYNGTLPNPTAVERFSYCNKLSVYDQPIKQFYSKAGQDLSLLTSWSTNADGTGPAPETFTGAFQVFNIQNSAQPNGLLTIGGVESFIWIRNGGELTLNQPFTGVLNIEGSGMVTVNTNQPVSFGSVSPTSTVRFGAAATTIPSATYGNVVFQGGSKNLPAGVLELNDLHIEAGTLVEGPQTGFSTLNLSGNLSIATALNPTSKFNVVLKGAGSKTLALHNLSLQQLTVQAGVSATVIPSAVSLEVGGLLIENTGELLLRNNTLTISGQGIIQCNGTGQIGFSGGNLLYQSQSAATATLRARAGADSIRALHINTPGALSVTNTLYVVDSLKIWNGGLQSNGVTLVSTPEKTARIAAITGTGNISGPIGFQRHIRGGRLYRYLTFPVNGATIDQLQAFIPVTGSFNGASKGPGITSGNPSTFRYANNQWLPYPTTDSTATLVLGTGYSVFMRNESEAVKVQLNGTVQQGNFTFALQPGSAADQDGWNLLGNPYAAPIHWNNDWNATGLGTTVYVRDNEQPNDPFLYWDGEVGDEAFGGRIAQGQSFWIKSLTSSPALTVSEMAKTNHAALFRTQAEKTPIVTLTLTQGTLTDKAYLKFKPDATLQFSGRTDAHKLKNNFHNLSIIPTDTILAAIKTLPDSCEVKIGLAVENVKAGTHTLSIAGTALDFREFLLLDLEQNKTVTVSEQNNFVFEVDTPIFGERRFELHSRSTLPQPVVIQRNDTLLSNINTDVTWLLNGKPISGATNAFFLPAQSGVYQVQARQAGCTKESEPFSFVITQAELAEPISVYPNPTQNQIFIKGLRQFTSYTLVDVTGKLVQQGLVTPTQNQLDVALPPGLYILTLQTATPFRIKVSVR